MFSCNNSSFLFNIKFNIVQFPVSGQLWFRELPVGGIIQVLQSGNDLTPVVLVCYQCDLKNKKKSETLSTPSLLSFI